MSGLLDNMGSRVAPTMLSVIMPAYRQARSIERDIRRLDAVLSSLTMSYEMIVVVDGQVDGTFKEAEKAATSHIRVIGYQHNHGKGYAVRYGMVRAKGDVVIFIDAGGDIRPEGIPILIEHFRWYNADIVVGSKRHIASKVHYPWYRKVFSWTYQQLIHTLFGLRIRDSQVGLKLFRRAVLIDVLPRLLVKRFAFDIEILAVANALGYHRIYEAPVELDFSGVSSLTSTKLWKEIFRMLWDTLAVFYRLRIKHYYDSTNKRKWVYDPELNLRINVG